MLPARRVPISELWLLLKLSRVKAGPQLAAVAKGHVKMSFASGSSHAHTHTHRSARNRARG